MRARQRFERIKMVSIEVVCGWKLRIELGLQGRHVETVEDQGEES